jgi:DHA1 family multidrug resistance protein-like MFS transporter
MVVGELIAFVVIWLDNPRYVRKLEANNNIPVPEWRLPIAMVGGVLFAGKSISPSFSHQIGH